MNKSVYGKPEVVEYGAIFGLTKGIEKGWGNGDGIFVQDQELPLSGPDLSSLGG